MERFFRTEGAAGEDTVGNFRYCMLLGYVSTSAGIGNWTNLILNK